MSRRLLYVYPEEWTGRRAREVQTLQTCRALAAAGVDLTLVTAGGLCADLAGALDADAMPPRLRVVTLSRRLGPIRSARLFATRLGRWLSTQVPFTGALVIHLKAARMLHDLGVPYWYEAHEIFAESPRPGTRAQTRLARLERDTLLQASGCIATSGALGRALNARYFPDAPVAFAVIPNAGDAPLPRSVADPQGPLAYVGSLGDWKGVPLAIEAAGRLGLPVRVVGGDAGDWQRLAARLSPPARAVATWRPRVAASDIPAALTGCRAGLIPTLPDTGSGRYSCPMKLFDYARCGLAVVTTDLPSLDSLEPGPWCTRVRPPSVEGWTAALVAMPGDGEAARRWATAHTWQVRAERLLRALDGG